MALLGALALAIVGSLTAHPAGADRAAPPASTTTTVVQPTTTIEGEVDSGGELEPTDVEIGSEIIVVDEFDPGPATTTVPGEDPEPDGPDEDPDDPEEIEAPEAPAQPDIADELGFGMEIHAGVRGIARAGHAVPVAIEIAAQRLITGELRLVATAGERAAITTQTIEVPGSSTKRFVIATPIAMGGFDDLTVELVLDGEVIVDHDVTVATDPEVEIVGVMGLVAAADSLPDTTELAVGSGTAMLVGLDAETLGAGLGGARGVRRDRRVGGRPRLPRRPGVRRPLRMAERRRTPRGRRGRRAGPPPAGGLATVHRPGPSRRPRARAVLRRRGEGR